MKGGGGGIPQDTTPYPSSSGVGILTVVYGNTSWCMTSVVVLQHAYKCSNNTIGFEYKKKRGGGGGEIP